MFNTPVKHTRLKNLEEVLNFSFRTADRATPMTKCQNNGQIAFADQYGTVYVTPYRTEIHGILEEAGYKEGSIFVPFSNGEERPDEYRWLAAMAEEENMAYTHEQAYKIACEKGIDPVSFSETFTVKEIIGVIKEDDTWFYPFTMTFLYNGTANNIGTYIRLNTKELMVCDEYGRTFLVRFKKTNNEAVNALLDAGYTRTLHPESYVRKFEPIPELVVEEEEN